MSFFSHISQLIQIVLIFLCCYGQQEAKWYFIYRSIAFVQNNLLFYHVLSGLINSYCWEKCQQQLLLYMEVPSLLHQDLQLLLVPLLLWRKC